MKKTALFLDRDGIINQVAVYLNKLEKFDSPQNISDILINDQTIQIIKWANDNHIPVIEATNQPGYAKGKLSKNELDNIEKYIHQKLSEKGAVIDKTYICYHHPKGIIPRLSIECDCRKPKPGLLLNAAKELNLDITNSIFLGDNATDVEAGIAAGCKTIIYIHKSYYPDQLHAAQNSHADFKVTSLAKVLPILKNYF